MADESELSYLCSPTQFHEVDTPIEFLTVAELLEDEIACQTIWNLVTTQFRTRSKFLAIWAGARFAALHRDPDGLLDGFLLVNAPVNWQIDYVVVRPDRRGTGIAGALIRDTLNQARVHRVPYVMLTSRAGLRAFYEGCGFSVVAERPDPRMDGQAPADRKA